MAQEPTDYGKATECEYPTCDRPRGAPKRSLYAYGCILCAFHETEYQKGNISLPNEAAPARQKEAEAAILG